MKRGLDFLLFTVALVVSICPRICTAQKDSICDTPGLCGECGICNSHDSPVCSCLQGFHPRNNQEWDLRNWSSGCVRRIQLSCGSNSGGTADMFLTLPEIKISNYTSRWFGPKDECEGRCLSNCSCTAYGFHLGIGCMFWSGALVDLQQFPSGLPGSDLHVRLAASELVAERKDSKKIKIIVVVVVVVIAFVMAAISSYFCCKWRAKQRHGQQDRSERGKQGASGLVMSSVPDSLSQFNTDELPLFKFETLAISTDNFSEVKILGQGGFGPVYKGVLVNGREIAIKRLSKASGQGMQEFMNEVALISKLQHRNLVRLLGCCVENKENMLIYEYMPNKSLDFFLFDPAQEILDWRKRFDIMKGVCRGLLYLHRDSRLKIIHRDLKPSNILLDNDWSPKISDFGMARIYETKQDHVSTVQVVGTYGYMAPEYAMDGRFSEKSDVFSFGILMLEIISGRRNSSFHHHGIAMNLLGHARKLWNEAEITSLVDPRISNPSHHSEVLRCVHIGLLCVQEHPMDRPSISAVLSMLNSETIELPAPKNHAVMAAKLKSSRSNISTTSSQQSQMNSGSVNDVTFTMVEGR